MVIERLSVKIERRIASFHAVLYLQTYLNITANVVIK